MSQRFVKSQRVRKRREFVRAQRCAVAARSRYCVLLIYLRGGNESARLGIVASKRVGGAVVRNRGKRSIREWFREDSSRFPPGTDVIVILQRGAVDCHYAALRDDLNGAARRGLRKAQKLWAAQGKPCADATEASS